MGDPIINNFDFGSYQSGGGKFNNDTLVFAGAETVLKGTLLARQKVDTAISVAADGGNTGNGTATASVTGVSDLPIPGIYLLTCTFIVTNGGVFNVTDPNGNVVASNLTLRVGDALLTTFVVKGITFVVTEGSTDFAAADFFTATVVANEKLAVFAIGGVAGLGVPVAISPNDLTKGSSGDFSARVQIAGDTLLSRLIIAADGDASNIDDVIRDQLRNVGINSFESKQLQAVDNPQP